MAEASCSTNNNRKNQSKRIVGPEHNFKKRQVHKPEIRENVIYVSTKSDLRGLRAKCEKLMKEKEKEVIIYCLGAAIQRGIVLALQLCEHNVSYNISTNTLTTELIDDLEPAADDADYEIQRRNNSALRIRLLRIPELEIEKK